MVPEVDHWILTITLTQLAEAGPKSRNVEFITLPISENTSSSTDQLRSKT
jgi:hypothetical protein